MAATFTASAQYDDWKGSCAADNIAHDDLFDLLKARKLMSDGEFPVGVKVYIGENQGGKVEAPYLEVLLIDRGDFDSANAALKAMKDPVPLKAVRLELTMDSFFGLFKRFRFALSPWGLDMENREYTTQR